MRTRPLTRGRQHLDVLVANTLLPQTCPARALRDIASYTRSGFLPLELVGECRDGYQ